MSARVGWCVALILAALLLTAAFLLDSAVHEWVVQHETPQLRAWGLFVSRWGDWPSHVVLGVLGALAAYFLGNRQWLHIFAAMIIACALAGAATRLLKVTAGRARPSVTIDAGWNGPRFSSKYHSFPSGHTAASMAFFAVPLFARRRLALLFLPIPFLIASGRVLLDAHYLSDIIFAAILGVFCAWLVWRFISHRYSESA